MASNSPTVRKLLLILGATFGGTGLFLAALFTLLDALIVRPVWDDWALDARGVSTEATPLSMRVAGTSNSRSGSQVVSHYVVVSFEDEEGEEHEAELMSADSEVFRRVREKEPLDIEYDPERPDLVRLEGETAALFGNFILIPLAVGLAGVWLLVLGLRRRAAS
jgi:hypothetical protein